MGSLSGEKLELLHMDEPAFDVLERGVALNETHLKVNRDIHLQVRFRDKEEGAGVLADVRLEGHVIGGFPFSSTRVMEAYSLEDFLKTRTNLLGGGVSVMVEEDKAIVNLLIM